MHKHLLIWLSIAWTIAGITQVCIGYFMHYPDAYYLAVFNFVVSSVFLAVVAIEK